MADKPIHFYDPLEHWDRLEQYQNSPPCISAQQAVQSVAGDFAHQLRGRGQHDLVDELRALCLKHGFSVYL